MPIPKMLMRGMCSLAFLALAALPTSVAANPHYNFHALVTDDQAALAAEGFGPADFVDPNLINPWGMSFAPGNPFWVSNQGAGNSTLYNGAGEPFPPPPGTPLVVTTPQVGPPAGPTGQIFNNTPSFLLSDGTKGLFFFANLDGSISGWNFAQATTAQKVVPSSVPGGRFAIYTGLAVGSTGGNDYLYAANNATGAIDVFDTSYNPVALAGNFVDPGANPAGLVPFNVQNIGGLIYVTYAVQGPDSDEAPLGTGFVSVFNPDGTFVDRFAEGGQMTSPWGITLAPDSFGEFGGALLIGNFHEDLGFINAFDPLTGAFLGQILDPNGSVFEIPYLWAILFGGGGLGGNPDHLYLVAGIGDELHGVLAELTPVAEPAAAGLLALGVLALALRRRRTTGLRLS